MPNGSRPPVSVILPTLEWGAICDQIAGQLQSEDELLVVCDTEDDPVASHEAPEKTEILIAGEPEGCAAKANAVAYGMEQATNVRFVWSDDDYERDSDWLDTLVRVGEKRGPTAIQPLFIGNGWSWRVFEPVGTLLLGLQTGLFWGGAEGGYPWGGGVTFTRDELDVPVEQLVTELRQCISDDNVLHEHVGDAYMIRDRTADVTVDGTLRDTARRLIRWMRADHVRSDLRGGLLGSLVVVALAGFFPLIVAPAVTVAAAVGYGKLGWRRWTFLLAYPGLFVLPVVLASGVFIDEFTWGSRRYRVNAEYDVEVL